MAQGYKLVVRKVSDLKGGAKVDKVFASPKYNGSSDIESISKIIEARSAVSSADVKSVIDNLNFVLALELAEGRIVYLGELGNFRLSVSSQGAESKEKFANSNVKKARLIFTPGKMLKKTIKTTAFTSLEVKEKTADTGKTEEKPGGL